MPGTEQLFEKVSKIGDDKVQIEEGLGEKYVLGLKDAKVRLKNLKKQKNNFASQEIWQRKIDVTEKAIAMLKGK